MEIGLGLWFTVIIVTFHTGFDELIFALAVAVNFDRSKSTSPEADFAVESNWSP